MRQSMLLKSAAGVNGARPGKPQAFQTERQPRRRLVVRSAQNSEDSSDLGAAFLFTMTSLVAAAPVLAAAEAVQAVKPSAIPTISTPTVPPAAVDSAVNQIIAAVKAAGGAVKSGVDVASQGADKVKQAADVAAPYVKRGIETAAPYVKAGAGVAQDVATPIVRAAGPVFQNGVTEVEQFLSKQGLNAQSLISGGKGVTSKAEEAINYASPTVKSTANTIQATSPQILAQYAFALVGVYYLGPPILKGIFGSLRGFAGQVSPAAALDAASNENAVIIDIRTNNEKEYSGIPDIPRRDRLIELEYASVTDRKIRGQLRNVDAIEKQMTIIQIAALKKVKKGTRVLLLDKNGSVAKDVAKGLNARGYKKVYVVDGGFNGWTSSKLQTRGSSSVSSVEVLGPLFGTRGTRNTKALPSGR